MTGIQETGSAATGGQGTQAEASLLPGARLGKWEIGRALGRGATSVTYLARDPESGAEAALKVFVPPGTAESPARDEAAVMADALDVFRREAELLGRLDHPGLPKLQDFQELDSGGFMALSYVDGRSLAKKLAAAPEAVVAEFALSVVEPLAATLGYLHEQGYLHRDLKPANIWLVAPGNVRLIDLGAALPLEAGPEGRPEISQATPGYAAPEQYQKDGKEGPWTDVYGLAAVAYRIVADHAPLDARARADGEAMAPAREAGAGRCPPELLAAIDAGLELDPRKRPQTVAEFFHAFGTAARAHEGMAADSAANHSDVAAVSKTPNEHPLDEYPPTERVTRVPVVRKPGSQKLSLPEGASLESASTTSRHLARAVGGLLFIVLLAGGAWGGWEGYLRYIKSNWEVDPSGAGDTVSIAEAMARARPGATITIRPGLYAESLIMTRPLHLLGAPAGEDLPQLAPETGPCLVARANGGSLRSIALKGAARRDNGPVPCLDLASNLVVADNRIGNASGPAVRLRDGADPILRDNVIAEVEGPAVIVESGARGTISGNRIEGTSKAGLIIRGGSSPTVKANQLAETGQAGILLTSGSSGQIEDNEIIGSRASGIEVRDGAAPYVRGNRIEASEQAGLFVYDGGRGQFENNSIAGNAYSGVVILSGGAPELTNNEIRENGEHGVLVMDGGKGRIEGNVIETNGGHGIALALDAGAEIGENELRGNAEPQVQTGEAAGP